MNPTPFTLLLSIDDPARLLAAILILVLAYGIFALMGFGSALLASAPLAWVMPVSRVVPLLALLDWLGSVQRAWQGRHSLDWHALIRLLPGMLLGQTMGVAMLERLSTDILAVLLGGFVAAYGTWGSIRGTTASAGGGAKPGRAWLHGVFGGVLGGLFGSGGFVYAAYLQPRLPDRAAFRSTQGVMIAVSTSWRIALCAAAGLVDGRLVTTALVLLPAAWLGMTLGARVDRRLSVGALGRGLHGLLIVSGLALIWRAIG